MKVLFARKGKNLAVVSLIALSIFSMIVVVSVQVTYAQQVEEQVESDDIGLTATLNGDTFARGDSITVRGTVAEREGGSSVYIDILDPDGIEHGTYTATVTNDLTFTFGLVAGQHRSMDKFGTYTIILTYFPPGRGSGIETTDVSFEYVSGTPPTGTTTAAPTTVIGESAINITAINQTAAQALQDLYSLNATLTDNITVATVQTAQGEEDIQTYINSIESALLNIQGNVTVSAPLEDVQVIAVNGEEEAEEDEAEEDEAEEDDE